MSYLKMYDKEATLTKKVKDYLKTLGDNIFFYKASDRYHPGIPDFVVCYKGKFVGLELKAISGEPSMHQLQVAQQIIRTSGEFILVRCVQDVIDILNKIDKNF